MKTIKYVGSDAIRFAATDGSFAGIVNPGETFSVSAYTYDLALKNDPRYQIAGEVKAIKKPKYEGKE